MCCIQQVTQPELKGMPTPDNPIEKSYRLSAITTVISVRIPNDANEVLLRRSQHHPGGVSGYARDRLVYDLTRKHHGRSE